jgi:hypothetical protein
MKTLKVIFLSLVLLIALSACENFRFDQKPHTWQGTISSLLNSFISSARAEDSICQSICKTNRCAHLVVHSSSSTNEIVCSTDATTIYKFSFSQNPNSFYDGKLIEIRIEDASDSSKNRSIVEVINKNSSQDDKDINIEKTFVSAAIKGHILNSVTEGATDLSTLYNELAANTTIADMNGILQRLTSLDLLDNINEDSDVADAQVLVNKLRPDFLGKMLKLYLESRQETEAYVTLVSLCSGNYSHAIQTTSADPALPACYLQTSSLLTGNIEAWNPVSELPDGCVLNSVTYQAICEDPVSHLLSIENLPSEPAVLADYTLASDHLANNYENHFCYNSSIRFGAFVVQDRSVMLVPGGLDYTHNPFMLVKAYSICQSNPTAYAYCADFDEEEMAIVQKDLATNGFCYF